MLEEQARRELGGRLLVGNLGTTPLGSVHLGRERVGDDVRLLHVTGVRVDELVERLRHDALELAASGHPALHPVLDVVADGDDGVVVVSAPVEETLAARVARAGPPRHGDLASLLVRLTGALAAAHGRGVRHGRFTTDAVGFVEGEAVLLDTGVAPLTGHNVGGPADDLEALAELALGWIDPADPGAVSLLEALERARAGRLDAADLAVELDSLLCPVTVAPDEHPVPTPLTPEPGARRARPTLAVAAAVVAVSSVIVLLVSATGGRGDPPVEVVEPANRRCADATPEPAPDTTLVWADVDGRGCDVAVRWSPTRAEAEVTTGSVAGRYRLGERGDQLVLGDWDGDGRAEPALYRPVTGEVFRWDGWATSTDPVPSVATEQTDVVGGTPRPVLDGDHHTVEVLDGTPT